MKEPREDDERLSALIDDQLRGREREDLLAHLSASEDDYAVFTDTSAVLQALEDEDAHAGESAKTGVVQFPPGGRGRGMPPKWLAIAAAVVGIVLISALALRGTARPAAGDPLKLAIRLDTSGNGLPAGWEFPAPAGTERGSGDGAVKDAQAVMAGAMLVDLAVAVRGGDSAQIREQALLLRRRLDRGAGAGTPLVRIAAGAPADSLHTLVGEARDQLGNSLGHGPLELGAWAEAARLAADAQNAAFFDDGASDGMLARAERLARGDRAARAVAQVRAALPRNGVADWDVLESHLRTMLSSLMG